MQFEKLSGAVRQCVIVVSVYKTFVLQPHWMMSSITIRVIVLKQSNLTFVAKIDLFYT